MQPHIQFISFLGYIKAKGNSIINESNFTWKSPVCNENKKLQSGISRFSVLFIHKKKQSFSSEEKIK